MPSVHTAESENVIMFPYVTACACAVALSSEDPRAVHIRGTKQSELLAQAEAAHLEALEKVVLLPNPCSILHCHLHCHVPTTKTSCGPG